MSLSKRASKNILIAAVMAAFVAAITGCSESNDVPSVGDSEVEAPLALRQLEGSSSAAAAFSGTVLLEGGCVALEVEGTLYTIVWLDVRTSWDPELQQVTMRRSGGLADLTATVGEFEDLGGQLVQEGWETLDWIDWAVKPGPDCPRNVAVI